MVLLSFYDMDKTITRRATYQPFLRYAVPRHRPWRMILSPFLLLSTLAYGARTIDRRELKEINTALMLGKRIDRAKLQKLAKGFAEKTIAKNVLKGALEQIEQDHKEGRRSIMATASYTFYVREIATLLNIDDVISTENRSTDAHHSFDVEGENVYGDHKLATVLAWMEREGLKREDCHIRFYSDHVSDAPALAWADEGYATNAHGPLRKLAEERGWTVLDWD